jgi:hypothetical protein
MGLKRNSCNILAGKREGNRSLDVTKRKWESNIKIDIRELYYFVVELINLAEDTVKGWAFVKMVMNLRVPLRKLIFLTDRNCYCLTKDSIRCSWLVNTWTWIL